MEELILENQIAIMEALTKEWDKDSKIEMLNKQIEKTKEKLLKTYDWETRF